MTEREQADAWWNRQIYATLCAIRARRQKAGDAYAFFAKLSPRRWWRSLPDERAVSIWRAETGGKT